VVVTLADAHIVLEELSGVKERPMISPMPTTARPQQRYDHRLRNLVQRTGDVTVATNLGVPRSTARGWLSAAPTVVVSLDVANLTEPQLRQEVLKTSMALPPLARQRHHRPSTRDVLRRRHNRVLPHLAFRGQPPDEMHFGTGDVVPPDLASRAAAARRARVKANRSAAARRARQSTQPPDARVLTAV
jgi:hypothetical protein